MPGEIRRVLHVGRGGIPLVGQPPLTAILRQLASPLNTSAYFLANSALVTFLRMKESISRVVGQMSLQENLSRPSCRCRAAFSRSRTGSFPRAHRRRRAAARRDNWRARPD
jgi:hypothetical protein